MTFFALTTVTSKNPTADTGSVTFDVADASVLPIVPFSAWHYPQMRGDTSGISRAKVAQKIDVTSVTGSTLTATLDIDTTGRAIRFGDIIDVTQTVLPGLQSIRVPAGADDSLNYPAPMGLEMLFGSVASPVTVEKPGLKLTKVEHITAPAHNLDPGYSALLSASVESASGNKNQSTAIWAQARGYVEGANYLLGGYFASVLTASGGGGSAGAIFAIASTQVAGTGAQAIATDVDNSTGANQAYNAAGNGITALDAVYSAPTNHYAGAGVQVRSANGGVRQWDVGYAVLTGSVRSAGFRDDGSATASYDMNGSHTYGIDMSGATISGAYLVMDAQYYMMITASNPVLNLDANDYFSYNRASDLFGFTINNVAVFVLSGGTPGAGNTNMALLQGAGPTLSAIKYKSGTTLGAGDNVLYF